MGRQSRGAGTAFTVDYLTVASPSKLYCHQETSFQPTLKILASFALPWSLQMSGTIQSVPGAPITATYVATSAQIAPSLGRNLSSGATATASIELIAPGTMYDDRTNQFDVRLSKILKVGRSRIQGNLDFYNVLNASPVLVANTTYGTNGAKWLVPTYVLPGRLLKFGIQLDF